MSFAWPWMLVALLAIPALVSGYRGLLARRAGRRAELASLGLVAPAAVTGRRRHVAPVLFLTALALLVVALARPQATVAEPHLEGTVILAFDSSASMNAEDMNSTRMDAAKAAARTFVQKQPSTIRVGVIAFGGTGFIVQRPTADRAETFAAIDGMNPQGEGATALARGLVTSLSALAGKTVQLDDQNTPEATGPDLGYYRSAAVILLTDGENTEGPDPIAVAGLVSTAGVRVYPIGLGSPSGTVVDINGRRHATALDEPTLKQIAATTDGRYFNATDQRSLNDAYENIDVGRSWTVRGEKVEITAILAAIAALLLVIGAGLSLAWYGRVI